MVQQPLTNCTSRRRSSRGCGVRIQRRCRQRQLSRCGAGEDATDSLNRVRVCADAAAYRRVLKVGACTAAVSALPSSPPPLQLLLLLTKMMGVVGSRRGELTDVPESSVTCMSWSHGRFTTMSHNKRPGQVRYANIRHSIHSAPNRAVTNCHNYFKYSNGNDVRNDNNNNNNNTEINSTFACQTASLKAILKSYSGVLELCTVYTRSLVRTKR